MLASRDQALGLTLDYQGRRDFLLASASHDIPSFMTSIVLITSVLIVDLIVLAVYTTWKYQTDMISALNSERQNMYTVERNGGISSHENNNNGNKEKGIKEDTNESKYKVESHEIMEKAEKNCVNLSVSGSRKRNLLQTAKVF